MKMCVIIRHNQLNRGIGDFLFPTPRLTHQGPPHAFPVIVAEARGSAVVGKLRCIL